MRVAGCLIGCMAKFPDRVNDRGLDRMPDRA